MTRCKFKNQQPLYRGIPLVFVQFLILIIGITIGSEFPDRECCDPIYPILNQTTVAPPTTSVSATSPEANVRRTGKLFSDSINYNKMYLVYRYKNNMFNE